MILRVCCTFHDDSASAFLLHVYYSIALDRYKTRVCNLHSTTLKTPQFHLIVRRRGFHELSSLSRRE